MKMKGGVEIIVHGERWKDSSWCLHGQPKQDKVTCSGRAHPCYGVLNDQHGACGEVCQDLCNVSITGTEPVSQREGKQKA